MTDLVAADVARLLAESRAAHLRYRDALGMNDPEGAYLALRTAYETRMAADQLDLAHEAKGWKADTTSHYDLIQFYSSQLAR